MKTILIILILYLIIGIIFGLISVADIRNDSFFSIVFRYLANLFAWPYLLTKKTEHYEL